MLIHFTKMHGLGNDFVVIDTINQSVQLSAQQARFIADRHFGVGCDQILLVEQPSSAEMDFRYRILNADGGEVEQCGNGARCFARFVRDQGLTDQDCIRVETLAGPIELNVLADQQVRVDMGVPVLEPARIPFNADLYATEYSLHVDDQDIALGVVSMGNPHAVIRVDDVDQAPVQQLGPTLEHHSAFPQRANIGFMQVIDPANIRLRVWERGAGETLACGTGACAAVVSGILRGWLERSVVVHLVGGELQIEWSAQDQPVMMTGPAESVYQGTIKL